MAEHTLALVAAPPASQISVAAAPTWNSGSFRFAFTNTPGAFFSVVAAANADTPWSNWTGVGDVPETSPGWFRFIDSQATNGPRRFYRVRSP